MFSTIEKEQADRRMDLLSFGRSTQTGMEVFEYEDLIREENLKDPQFLYATLSESLDAYMITNLQPNTNYAVAINVQVKYGTIMNNPIHCRVQTLPGTGYKWK